jgi:hypothetical protein
VLRGCAASSEPHFGQAAIDIVFIDVSDVFSKSRAHVPANLICLL